MRRDIAPCDAGRRGQASRRRGAGFHARAGRAMRERSYWAKGGQRSSVRACKRCHGTLEAGGSIADWEDPTCCCHATRCSQSLGYMLYVGNGDTGTAATAVATRGRRAWRGKPCKLFKAWSSRGGGPANNSAAVILWEGDQLAARRWHERRDYRQETG